MNVRNTARVVLLDELDRLLLLKIDDGSSKGAFWVTPGGEIEVGETAKRAAMRELWEETGISEAQFGSCIWREEVELSWNGKPVLSREQFFFARVGKCRVSFQNLEENEKPILSEFRWFSVADLETTSECFFPKVLPRLIRGFLKKLIIDRPTLDISDQS